MNIDNEYSMKKLVVHFKCERAIMCAELEKIKEASKLSEKYKKRYFGLKAKNFDPETPRAKVSPPLKVLKIVKTQLLFGEVLSRELKTNYHELTLVETFF